VTGALRPSGRRRWHEAADRAGFTFFEPVSSDRTHLWAGGFGWGTDEPQHLGIQALVSGAEIGVETSIPIGRDTEDSRTRRLAVDLLFHFLLDDDEALNLPLVIKLVPEVRAIAVAGRKRQFSGVRVEGSKRWAGEADHDGVVIRVVAPTDALGFALESCRDWAAMSEMPPAAP
jgi:hypothetical protein